MAIAYCTDRELKDVYPHIDDFDNKTPIYGWEQVFTHGGNTLYEAFNSGLVTVLYKDGKDLGSFVKTESYSDSTANTAEAVDNTETAIDVTDGSVFGYGDIIKINNEKMIVTNISSNTLTVRRGALGTTIATHNTGVDVYIGVSWSNQNEWLYSSTDDHILYFGSNTSSPNDLLMEAGEDYSSLKQRYRENASRYLESKLDKTLPREQFKDKDGNYDYIIVRTTALLATVFLIRSHDPTSEVASNMMEEAQAEIDKLNSGDNVLSWMKTADSSKGIVREVSVSGGLKIVDTRGRYYGVYDRVGVKITTGGALGTAKYSVWRKDSENLGAERMNNSLPADFADEVINGQYQSLSGGLEIRFGGDTADTATLGDKWEIELSGYFEEVDNASSMRSARMTRL